MGTLFRIVLYAPDSETAARAAGAAFERIAQLDAMMSDYRESSELMSLCRQAGGPAVKVSDDLFGILTRAQEVAARSGGAFDVTVGPLVRLWRRARRTGEMPDAQSLAEALRLTGYGKIHLDPQARSVRLKQPGMLLDLGGIAKGYAAGEAVAVLRKRGIPSALVAGGGDIVVSGPPPGSPGWVISVSGFGSYLSLREAAVSTSGDAEQHVEIGDVRYSHIIDPKTGMGVVGRSSVTVVAPDGATSDALATAASVMGPQRALEMLDSMDGVAAFIAQGQRTFESKHWKDMVYPGPVIPSEARNLLLRRSRVPDKQIPRTDKERRPSE